MFVVSSGVFAIGWCWCCTPSAFLQHKTLEVGGHVRAQYDLKVAPLLRIKPIFEGYKLAPTTNGAVLSTVNQVETHPELIA